MCVRIVYGKFAKRKDYGKWHDLICVLLRAVLNELGLHNIINANVA